MTGITGALSALFSWLTGKPAARPADIPDEVSSTGEPAWLQRARRDLGQHEIAGPAANPVIMSAWRYVDCEPPKDDSTAYCSAKMCQWTEESGLPSTRAPNARSWLKWGSELKTPKPGCIVVFWRGSVTSWEGHVAIYLGTGEKPGTVRVLGANQSDSISIAEYSASQVLSYRWPTTGGNSRTLKAQAAGLIIGDGLTATGVSGAAISQQSIIDSLPDALALGTGLQSLATYWPWFAVIGILISILARMITIYARVSDWKKDGV